MKAEITNNCPNCGIENEQLKKRAFDEMNISLRMIQKNRNLEALNAELLGALIEKETLPQALDDEDIEQIEMIINTIEDRVEAAHKQQYVKILYEWYKSATN